MTDVRILKHNHKSQIKCDDQDLFDAIRVHFRQENDIWKWKGRGKNGRDLHYLRWNYIITEAGYFRTGILTDVDKYIRGPLSRRFGRKLEISYIDKRRNIFKPDADHVNFHFDGFPYTLRPYQKRAYIKGIKNPRGTFNWATGGGKTVLMGALIRALHLNTLVLVGSVDLGRQLQHELEILTEEEVGFIGGGEFNPKKFTIGLVMSLTGKRRSKKKQERAKEFLETVEYLCVDEAHHSQSKSYKAVADACKGAFYRHGFTATLLGSKIQKMVTGKSGMPYAKKVTPTQLLLTGVTGPAIDVVTIKYLVDRGYLAHPKIVDWPYSHGKGYRDFYEDYSNEYENEIAANEDRNRLVASITAFELEERDSQVLIFVKRIEQGHLLYDYILETGVIEEHEIEFLHGSVSKTKRATKISEFKHQGFRVLIGTTILGEGLNFFCDVGIQACAGDSDIMTIQRLGRVLRKKPSKSGDVDTDEVEFTTYYDLGDRSHKWFQRHSRSRRRVYEGLEYPAEEALQYLGKDVYDRVCESREPKVLETEDEFAV